MTIPSITPEQLSKLEAEFARNGDEMPKSLDGLDEAQRTLVQLIAAARELHEVRHFVKTELVIEGDYHPGPEFNAAEVLRRDRDGWVRLREKLEERARLDLIELRGLLDWFVRREPEGWLCRGCNESVPRVALWHEQDCPTRGLEDMIRAGAKRVDDENVRSLLLDGPSERREEGRVYTGVSLRDER